MNKIEELRDRLLNSPENERLKAAEEFTKMASEGNDEAAEILYEMLEKEDDPEVWIKPFEVPPESLEDRRIRFVYKEKASGRLPIMPILRKRRDITEHQRTSIIEFAKTAVELYEADNWNGVPGAIMVLSYLAEENDLFNFVDVWLKRGTTDISDLLASLKHYPSILEKIILAVKRNPNEYSQKFVELFDWLLRHPLPDTAELIGKELWLNLPSKYKEAVRLHYYRKTEDLYDHSYHLIRERVRGYFSIQTKHPFLEWLEGFERGAVTSSIASYSALQIVAEKMGLHLKDAVKEIETLEPSPIAKERKRREPQSEEEVELIPIDKSLGQYFPEEQLIKLYMTEIRDSAKTLGVGEEVLRRVVEFHESVHAIVHLGRDADGMNFNTGAFRMVDGGTDPSPLHETLAQLFTYHCVKDDPELLECFEKLATRQPEAYQNWNSFTDMPLERIRNILVSMRQGRIEASFDMFVKIVI